MESHWEAQWAEGFQAASVRIAGRKWGSWEEAQHQEGGRQVKQTGFPEAASLTANKQLQSIEASRAASSRACSWFVVQAKPPHGEPLVCSHSPCSTGAANWHHQVILPGVWQLDWGQDVSLHASLPTCKSCPPHPSIPVQGFSGWWTADLRKGVSRKIKNFGSDPGLRGETRLPGSATGRCSNGKCNLRLPDLIWSEGILLDRGMG